MKTLALILAVTTSYHPTMKQKLDQTRFEAFAVDMERGTTRQLQDNDRIPYEVQNSCYMWRVTFFPELQPVRFEETLILPGAAMEWGSNPQTTVDEGRRSATTEVVADPLTGQASNIWCVAAGDPEGPYEIRVHRADSSHAGSIKFFVGNNR